MALPTPVRVNSSQREGQGSSVGSVSVAWSGATTAASNPRTPLALTANIVPLAVGPNVTRILLRARLTSATTAVATSPVVFVYAVYPTVGGPDSVEAGILWRVDNTDPNGAGLTLTLPGTPANTNMTEQVIDSVTYRYGTTVSLDGTDLKGARWALVVVSTAASITDGACDVEALVID